MKISGLAFLPFLALGLPAQTKTLVSPIGLDLVEGSGGNSFPWGSTTIRRYLQIHSDVKGTPMLVSMLSWRMNGGNTTLYTGTRVLDVELFMGNCVEFNRPSFRMDNNYIGPRAGVMARKVVNFGPQGQNATPGPAPFQGMDLPLDTPFPYAGAFSLIWEALVYSNAAGTGTFNTSTDVNACVSKSGSSSTVGAGCIASGQTSAMALSASLADMGGDLVLGFSAARGPAGAPVILALGVANPDLPYPGLCSNLNTDLVVVAVVGTTDAAGALAAGPGTAFVAPNSFPGAVLYAQLHAPDAGSAFPLPVVNSNGLKITIPGSDLTRQPKVARIFNNAGGITATDAVFFATSTVGYGLITRFTY